MINFEHKIFKDVTLKYTPWLEINVKSQTEAYILSCLEEILRQKIALMKTNNIHSLHLISPIGWNKLHENLENTGWSRTLTTLQKNIGTDLYGQTVPKDINLSNNISNPEAILSLLKEQAGYHSHLYPEYYKSANDIDWNSYSSELSTELNDSSTLATIAVIENHPVGYIQGEFNDNQLNIYELVVSSLHQRKGIGSILLKSSIQKAYENNTMTVSLETFWNQPSLTFYLKHQFIPIYQEHAILIN